MREKFRELKEIEKDILKTFDDLKELRKNVNELWKIKYQEKCKECEDLECDKEELEYHIEVLEEKIKKIEDDRDDNYRPIPMSEMLDISDRDFI